MKLLYCLSHPIQYQSPLIRNLVQNGIDITVAYGNGSTANTYHDKEFGTSIKWDVPLLEGYKSTILEEKNWFAELLKLPAQTLWAHGWSHPYAAMSWRIAKIRKLPLLVRGETFLGCVKGGLPRRLLHRVKYTWQFRQPSAFLAVGSLNKRMYRSYGVQEERIFSVPYAVNNAFFREKAQEASCDRETLKNELNISKDSPVILFCGKLIPKKGASLLIKALGSFSNNAVLVIVGDGELKSELEALANDLIPNRSRFVGFKNQTELPSYYDLCDIFVIPSTFEPWGLVVNEVMNAGKAIIASDQVGSAADLVTNDNGGIFPSDNVIALADLLKIYLQDRAKTNLAGKKSLEKIQKWSYAEDFAGLQQALQYVKASL
jgi:glycosyltransferase involved in cell wall biosynthesis